MQEELSISIKNKANELGYDLCGIIKADSFYEYTKYLNKRVDEFPDSTHLYKHLFKLAEPLEKADWGKSIIVCIRRYNKYIIPRKLDRFYGKVYLFDGRLTNSKEYAGNTGFTEYLKQQGMRTCEDVVTARWAAAKAGLGYFGKNNFIYTKFGSFVWIDTWVVDFELKYDKSPDKAIQKCPENCHRCIDACPTKALSDEFSMDRGICIAHLSFNSTELPSEELRSQMGTWIYGCDVCQDVCPMNNSKWNEEEGFPDLDMIENLLTLEQIFTIDENTLLEIIQPRFWYITKDRIWLWKCNAIRAMVNSRDSNYNKFIIEACNNENDNIRIMALWAKKQLGLQN